MTDPTKERTRSLHMRHKIYFVAGLAVILAGLLAIKFLASRVPAEYDWKIASADFAAQLNSIGSALRPGEVGEIAISPSPATELIVLPAYCTFGDLAPHLRDCPKGVVERLLATSCNNRTPVLLWIRNCEVLFSYDLRPRIAVNLSIKRWHIQNGAQIKLGKEKQSTNGFLSTFFLD
jgi:hypothetical protein